MESQDRQLYEYKVGAPALTTTHDVAFSLSTNCEPEHFASFGDVATFKVRTGSCDIQTYLTPHACRQIAAALTVAADRVEARVPPMQEAA
jgi:hypothetical protein